MNLEDAVKKAYGDGFEGVSGYKIDGQIVNLDLKSKDDSIYPGRIIFETDGRFTCTAAHKNDIIEKFANEVVKNM